MAAVEHPSAHGDRSPGGPSRAGLSTGGSAHSDPARNDPAHNSSAHSGSSHSGSSHGDSSQSGLSHLDADGHARMVDVSGKPVTVREAVAAGRLYTTPEVVARVRADDMPKADVLATARIAGINAAKHTWELIPLCHQLALSSVRVDFALTASAIEIEATVKTTGPTGVEMEALTAVAVAGLTLHDMVKAVDPAAVLTDVRLLRKSGGKRGVWTRDRSEQRACPSPAATPANRPKRALTGRTATVVVASTAAAAGTRIDATGPVIAEWLRARGYQAGVPVVCADADVARTLTSAVAAHPTIIVTTGGTGPSPTDATVAATRAVLTRELPGIAEEIRRAGAAKFPRAMLSGGLTGLAGNTVVVNLPGSAGGVADGLAVLDQVLEHLVAQVAGEADHGPS